jgi:hypothetical protein
VYLEGVHLEGFDYTCRQNYELRQTQFKIQKNEHCVTHHRFDALTQTQFVMYDAYTLSESGISNFVKIIKSTSFISYYLLSFQFINFITVIL